MQFLLKYQFAFTTEFNSKNCQKSIWTHLDPFHETYVNVHSKEYAPLNQNRYIFSIFWC